MPPTTPVRPYTMLKSSCSDAGIYNIGSEGRYPLRVCSLLAGPAPRLPVHPPTASNDPKRAAHMLTQNHDLVQLRTVRSSAA